MAEIRHSHDPARVAAMDMCMEISFILVVNLWSE